MKGLRPEIYVIHEDGQNHYKYYCSLCLQDNIDIEVTLEDKDCPCCGWEIDWSRCHE